MDKRLRQAQNNFLKIFSHNTHTFALAGGTALELYYLHHRFSADLDFFSPRYSGAEIDNLISEFKKGGYTKLKRESEFIAPGRAQVCFYTMPVKGTQRPLKIDFVQDVLFDKPTIKRFNHIPVYSVENIYLQKIAAITGLYLGQDEIGRSTLTGRQAARDVFDIYMLSRKIQPLHIFLKEISRQMQRGMVHWYQTFSRQELKLALLDLDIYDKKFDSREMIEHLEKEIKVFIGRVLE